MAVLELLAGSARTWVITSDLLLYMYRHSALRLSAVSDQVSTACVHLAHVRLARLRRCLRCRAVTKRNMSTEKECKNILVHVLEHLAEEVEALELVDEERILLLVSRVLNRLLEVVHITEMLLPAVVDPVKHDALADSAHELTSL